MSKLFVFGIIILSQANLTWAASPEKPKSEQTHPMGPELPPVAVPEANAKPPNTSNLDAPPPASSLPSGATFLEAYPHLKNYLYNEPESGFYLGLGISPVGVVKNSMLFTANFFSLHYIQDSLDIEILNASYGFTRQQDTEFESTHYTFRTSPKWRFFGVFSVGPVAGYELVNFPNVGARVIRGNLIQPQSEPFSANGWIFGGMLSQTFSYGKEYVLKLNEMFYQESYSTDPPKGGWTYIFDDQKVQYNKDNISAARVIMIEINFLY